jgi:hypothetical protein
MTSYLKTMKGSATSTAIATTTAVLIQTAPYRLLNSITYLLDARRCRSARYPNKILLRSDQVPQPIRPSHAPVTRAAAAK